MSGPKHSVIAVLMSALILTSCSNSSGSAPSSTAAANPLAAGASFTALAPYLSANGLQCVGDALRTSLGADRVGQLHLDSLSARQPLTPQDAKRAAAVVAGCPAVRVALVSVLLTDASISQQRAACVVAAISETAMAGLVEGLLVAAAADVRTVVAAASASAVATCPAVAVSPATVAAGSAGAVAKTLARRIRACGEPVDESPSSASVLAVARCGTTLRVEVYANNNSRDQAVVLRKTLCSNATKLPSAEVVLVTDLIVVSGNEAAIRQAATDLSLTPQVLCVAK
jgi:hypothetical protein